MGRGALIILVCAAAAGAQNSPRGHHAILDKVAEAYTQVQSYRVEAVVTTQRKGGSASVKRSQEILSIAYTAPNRLRLESNAQPSVTVFHDRGISTIPKGMSVYRAAPAGTADSRQTVNDYKHRRDALAKIGFTDYTAVENGMESARVLRQESIDLDGEAVPCSVVEASYPHGVKRTFWVDTQRNVVLREVDLGPGEGAAKGTELEHTIAVKKLSWNVPLPDTLFDGKPSSPPVRSDGSAAPVALVRCQQPEYTEEARIGHLAGLVTMSLTVDDDGMPNDIHVVNPLGLGLDESAVSCMGQSRYSPAQKDGKPIPLKMSVSLSFQEHWDSDWHLGAAAFHTAAGVSRPILVKAKYPGSSGDKRNATVCVRLTIDKEGVPRDVQVATPQDPKLDKQAVSIAGGWRFRPGMKNGQPLDVSATFNLVHGAGDRPVANGHELQ
jgi:TonB family protein